MQVSDASLVPSDYLSRMLLNAREGNFLGLGKGPDERPIERPEP